MALPDVPEPRVRAVCTDEYRARLVLVHRADKNPAGSGVYFINGDTTDAADLERAGIRDAEAALVFGLVLAGGGIFLVRKLRGGPLPGGARLWGPIAAAGIARAGMSRATGPFVRRPRPKQMPPTLFVVAVIGSLPRFEDVRGFALAQMALVYPAVLFTLRLKYGEFVVLRTFSKAWGLAGLRCGFPNLQAHGVALCLAAAKLCDGGPDHDEQQRPHHQRQHAEDVLADLVRHVPQGT